MTCVAWSSKIRAVVSLPRPLTDINQNDKNMQLKPFDLNRYSERSQKYAKTWLLRPNVEILGVKYFKSNDRDEDKVFYRYLPPTNTDTTKIHIELLPVKNSGYAPCYMGDLDWLARNTFAKVFADSKEVYGYHFGTCQEYAWFLDRPRMLRIQRAIQRLVS